MSSTFWVSEKDLDTEQSRAIEQMKEDESFLILGPAGSGKTNILLLRSRWFLFKKLSELRLVVFTASLRDFLRSGCAQYKIPIQNVVTCFNLFIDLLRQYHVDFELTGSFEADRAMLAGKVRALIEQKKIRNLYDALLVDECQDYMDTELLSLRELTSRLILVADSRQSVYRITHTPGLLEKLVGGNVVALKYHYRSGLKLCKVADAILRDSANFPPMHGECKYPENDRPSSFTLKQYPDFPSQINAIIDQLPDQLDLYPNELIGILFPKREQVSEFEAALSASPISGNPRVFVDTMHGAKGLEFRAVHVGGCEALYRMGPTQKRLVYTAILRGRTAAALYVSGSVPGYLESAAATIEPPPPDPGIASLFGS